MGEKVPEAKNLEVNIKVCEDSIHVTDLVTRRIINETVIFVQYTIVKNYPKCQNTVEMSTYGSELMSMRLAVAQLLYIH